MFGNIFSGLRVFFRNKKLNSVLDKRFLANVKRLESLIGFKICDQSYYLKSLTHRSYLELYPELQKSNERLEFLGDAVLNMIVGKYLFDKFPDETEGFLTKSRSSMVNKNRLFDAADGIGFKDLILYNEKYLRGHKDGFKSIMADALEALIGAIYLDRGLDKARDFINRYIIEPFEEDESFIADTNFKGQLLELSHIKKLDPPKYITIGEEGPSHKKDFTVEVFLGDTCYGRGFGKNKKTAEQDASKQAIENIRKLDS